MIDAVINDGDCIYISNLDIDGADISRNFGLQGRKIGDMLKSLLDAVINDKVKNRREELAEYAKTLCEKAKGENRKNG